MSISPRSPSARFVRFRHQFHSPGGRWFLTLHVAPQTMLLPDVRCPICFPHILLVGLDRPPDPTKSGHLPSTTRSQAEFSIKAPFYNHRSPRSLIKHLTFADVLSPRPSTRAPDLSCAALQWAPHSKFPSPISTCTATLLGLAS